MKVLDRRSAIRLSSCEKELGGLDDLRNRIMHPADSLIDCYEDVAKLRNRVERLKKAILRVCLERENAVLVWQYGSNMDEERINSQDRLKGLAKSAGIAILKEHRLSFTHTNLVRVGTADIVADKSDYVIGSLYEIPYRMLKKLDKIEGVNSGAYRRERISVAKLNEKLEEFSEPVRPITYVVVNKEKNPKTNADYANHILRGIITHKIGKSYFDKIKNLIILNNPNIQKDLLSYPRCE